MQPTNLLKHSVTASLEVHEDPQTGYKSLYTTQDIPKGNVLSTFGYQEKLSKPTRYSVQVNEQEHIILDPEYLQYINHSCAPNVFFDTQKMEIQVLKSIEAGEQITFFYPSNEWNMTEPFDCSCGSENCLQQIQGAAYLNYNQLAKYQLSAYIVNKFQNLKA